MMIPYGSYTKAALTREATLMLPVVSGCFKERPMTKCVELSDALPKP